MSEFHSPSSPADDETHSGGRKESKYTGSIKRITEAKTQGWYYLPINADDDVTDTAKSTALGSR